MQDQKQRTAWFKPLVTCLIAGKIGHWLWPYGQLEGGGLSCLIAAFMWFACVRLFFTFFERVDFATEMRTLRRLSAQPSRVHGEAAWGNLQEAEAAGLMEGPGIFLGKFHGKTMHNPGLHTLTIASSGMGKGVSIICPGLFLNPNSMIVNDVKGELVAIAARARRALGNDVVVLNPLRQKMTRELGVDLGDTRYNPLCILKPGLELKDEAELVASWLCPGQPGMSDSEKYWSELGQSILAGTMIHLVNKADGEDITLPQLRKTLMVTGDGIQSLLEEMAESTAYQGLVSEYGGRLAALFETSGKEFSGGLGSAIRGLKCYDQFGEMGAHVSGNEFDFSTVKKRPTTVFIVLPSDRDTLAPWRNLVISSAIEIVSRARNSKPVNFILDEAANLGFLPGLLKALSLSRSAGLRFHLVGQQMSQFSRIYKEGFKEIIGLSECINTFGVWEPETLKYLSDWVGQETVRDVSYNAQAGDQFTGEQDVRISSADRARALIRPEEIRRMSSKKQIVLYRNAPPFQVDLVSYLEDKSLAAMADPNPYHRSEKNDGE